MSGTPASAPPGLAFLAPLRVRNYRVQWPADLLTSWAFEMEVVLLGWYVLTQSNSVLLVSVIGAMPFIGTLLSPVFGMVGDRIGLRNLLCLMRCTYLFNSLLLLACAMTGMLSVGIVIAIAFMTGLVRPSDLGVCARRWSPIRSRRAFCPMQWACRGRRSTLREFSEH